jgi:NAD+ diphosphatase
LNCADFSGTVPRQENAPGLFARGLIATPATSLADRHMTAHETFPLDQPAFVSNVLDRAAHLRGNDEKLFALEGRHDARAYVVHRDSLVLKHDEGGPRALLTIDEALKFGANPGTIFLGLRDGAPVFGMGIAAAAVEQLLTREDAAVSELRGMAMQGAVPANQLAAIAMAKSVVSWHQRHGFCANCGTRTAMSNGGWRRDCPNCKTEHFPRTDPVVIMLVASGDKCLLGRQKQFPPGMWSCLAGFVEAAETIEDAVKRETLEESGISCTDVAYYMTQPWPYPSSLMIGCSARATSDTVVVDHDELEDARWFDRTEATLLLKREHPDGLTGPHPFAIAHHLLRRWVQQT